MTGGNRSTWRKPCSIATSSATNLTRTGPGSNEAFAMRGRRDRSNTEINLYYIYVCVQGHAVAQLDEALRYKSEGRGFDSRWCHWNFSLT